MKKCGVRIEWSDGDISECPQMCDNDKHECYAHEKYFTKVNIGGTLKWMMSPAYVNRVRAVKEGDHYSRPDRYIVCVASPSRGVARRIGHEYDDELDIAIRV